MIRLSRSGTIRFYGQASHADAAPERGRSALDDVAAMTYMVNLMREHVPEKTRIRTPTSNIAPYWEIVNHH